MKSDMRRFPIAALCVAAVMAQSPDKPVRAVPDPGVVTTRQSTTPAGVQSVFNGRIQGVAFGASSSELWVLNDARAFRFDWRENRVIERVPLDGAPGLQGIQYDAAGGRALVTAAVGGRNMEARGPNVHLLGIANGTRQVVAEGVGKFLAGALAIARKPNPEGRRIAAVPLIRDNKLAIVDLTGNRLLSTVPAGIAPFGVALSEDGTVAYVSNWGGRAASPNEPSAPTGLAPAADRVAINGQGIASTGTVTRIDLSTGRTTHTIAVELHPTALAWDETHNRLYVANGNSDSISVIDTRENRLLAGIPLQPFAQRVAGIAPTALAISSDGARLFVACGGINAVAVVDTASGKVEGLIPTAWYPNALSLSRDGKYLAVSCLLGSGSGWREEPRKRFVHAYRGSAAVIAIPDRAQLAGYTTAVVENNRLSLVSARPDVGLARGSVPAAVPRRAGEPSLIEHVVYIIKENRTYDQILGDIAKGNGNPSLVMFPESVTPNQHRLASQFVLLDNFYASGGNSADGHQWATQANETDYCLWPGYAGRSYPFDGTDPIAYSKGGFIWDAALRMKRTARVYGEYAPRVEGVAGKQRTSLLERWKSGADFSREWDVRSPIPALDKILAHQYPSYCLGIPDVVRAQLFLSDLKRWEREGSMPNLTILLLPSNHTMAATPGVSSAKAMVADNDLALGEVVEALSGTPFWKKMAIFVVEDDAQDGVDHVDGHRTVALAISPYVRRGYVDSTFYSHQSILKTIELILGLPTLSLFDLIANDMRASFQDLPDASGYTAVMPEQSLFELNPPLNALSGAPRRAAADSMRMRWDVPDAVPSDRVNRILWHQTKGWTTPYPATKRSAFAPLSVDVDDDARE
jgi:YVTN family beta-propeller protein